MNYILLIFFLLIEMVVAGQQRSDSLRGHLYSDTNKRTVILFIDSTNMDAKEKYLSATKKHSDSKNDTIVIFEKRNMQNYVEWVKVNNTPDSTLPMKPAAMPAAKLKKPFLKIHGNVEYDVNYYSSIDTPYAEKEIYQHTLQTYLDITVKDKYPMRFYFTTRLSNSNLFKNFSDLNLQFNPLQFKGKLKEEIKNRLLETYSSDSLTAAITKKIDSSREELNQLKRTMPATSTIQQQIEERERKLNASSRKAKRHERYEGLEGMGDSSLKSISILKKNNQPKADTSITFAGKDTEGYDLKDSIDKKEDKAVQEYSNKKKKIDSLEMELTKLEKLRISYKAAQQSKMLLSRNAVDSIQDIKILQKKLHGAGIADSSLPKGYQFIWSLRSFSIGRSIVDYSELSAKNISITGVQAEYNPRYYYAVAAGFVDYRFRNFIIQNNNAPRQYLTLVRAGKGFKDGNNIIVTYYSGQKQLFNSGSFSGGQIPAYRLMGFTIESRYNINSTNYLVAEIAKSSLPYNHFSSENKNLLSGTFKLSDHSNEAYSIKLNSFLPSTFTKINIYYKHFGANFQSFSLFTTGTTQNSWSIKVDQPFFKKHLIVAASVRANDFTNPFINRDYKSSSVFKSLQATFRMKKLPVVSAGYYPSSQLTKTGEGQFTENLFYTFNASVSHFYRYRNMVCNSILVYTQFYNKANDSGFVYFNTKNLMLSQQVLISGFSVQLTLAESINNEYRLYTAEHNLNYKISDFLSVGGGVKYNKQTTYDKELWGYNANVSLKIVHIGEIQLLADKGFVPGGNKQLVPYNTGRVSYFKVF